MLSAIVWTPKRHFLMSQRVFWDISREIPCPGCFSRRIRGKINKKIWCYISRICPDVPLPPIGTKFGLLFRLVDVINCANFYRNRSRGFDSVRVEVWPFPLDSDFAVNTVWTTVIFFILMYFSRTRLLKSSVGGFSHTKAQITRNHARKCLFGVCTMAENI